MISSSYKESDEPSEDYLLISNDNIYSNAPNDYQNRRSHKKKHKSKHKKQSNDNNKDDDTIKTINFSWPKDVANVLDLIMEKYINPIISVITAPPPQPEQTTMSYVIQNTSSKRRTTTVSKSSVTNKREHIATRWQKPRYRCTILYPYRCKFINDDGQNYSIEINPQA